MIKANYKEEHELTRKNLWINVFIAYTNSSNSTSIEYGHIWADKALTEFDKRFKKHEEK